MKRGLGKYQLTQLVTGLITSHQKHIEKLNTLMDYINEYFDGIPEGEEYDSLFDDIVSNRIKAMIKISNKNNVPFDVYLKQSGDTTFKLIHKELKENNIKRKIRKKDFLDLANETNKKQCEVIVTWGKIKNKKSTKKQKEILLLKNLITFVVV